MKNTFYITLSLLMGVVLSQSAWAQEHDFHSMMEALNITEKTYGEGPVLTVSGAIEVAMKNSPRIKAAAAALEAAKGEERQAGAWPNPEIEFEMENFAGVGEFKGAGAAEYTYGIGQTIEIGKRGARKNAATAARKAAQKTFTIEKLDLERDVYITYSSVIAQIEAVRLGNVHEEVAAELLETVKKRKDAGLDAQTDLLKAEAAYSISKVSHNNMRAELRGEIEALVRLMGLSKLENSLDDSFFLNIEEPEAIDAYRKRLPRLPDMQKLAFMKEEKESLLSLERAQVVPDIDLGFGVRSFSENGDRAIAFSVSVPLPILDRNGGNVARARAEVRGVESEIRLAELDLEKELVANWQEFDAAYKEVKMIRETILPTMEKALELTYKAYKQGGFPYLEVLDAQSTLFDTIQEYNNSLKRYHTARANLKRLATTENDE